MSKRRLEGRNPEFMVPEEDRLKNIIRAKELEADSLLELTQAINNNLPSSSLFRIYEFILRAQLGIKKAVLFIKGDRWKCLGMYGVKEVPEVDFDQAYNPELNKPIFRASFLKGASEFASAVKVLHKDKLLALGLIGDLEERKMTSGEGLKFVETITNVIVVAVENKRLFKKQLEQERIERDLELAARIQSMLVPDKLPREKSFKFSSLYNPHSEVGGDYFDVIKRKDEFVICIGDVSGKGISASLLMANFQANLRALVKQNFSLENLVKELNERIFEITKGNRFVTFFIGILDKKRGKINYINAGHNPPIMISQNKLNSLDSGSTILGSFEELPFIEKGTVPFEKGDFLLLFTDGITETENETGEFFGRNKLENLLADEKNYDPESINQKVLNELDRFKGSASFNDDITLLSVVAT